MEGSLFRVKICEKNSSVILRFEISVMAFRIQKLFGTFEKRVPALSKCFLVIGSTAGVVGSKSQIPLPDSRIIKVQCEMAKYHQL